MKHIEIRAEQIAVFLTVFCLLPALFMLATLRPVIAEECSTFLWRQATKDGGWELYLAKNRDRGIWEKGSPTRRQEEQEIVVKNCQRTGHTLTGVQTRGGGVTMGINTLGLAAVINMAPHRTRYRTRSRREWQECLRHLRQGGAIPCRPDAFRANAESLLQRYGRVEELLDDLRRGRLAAHKIITVADVDGRGAIIEFLTLSPPRGSGLKERVWAAWREWPRDSQTQVLQTTNHYRLDVFLPFNEAETRQNTSYRRGRRLATLLSTIAHLNLTQALAILRDHQGFPFDSLCSHKDLADDPKSPTRTKTIAAAIYHARSGDRYFHGHWCIGNPCLGEFVPIAAGQAVPPFFGRQSQEVPPADHAARLFLRVYRTWQRYGLDPALHARLARLAGKATRLRLARDGGRADRRNQARLRAINALLVPNRP